MTIHTQTGSQSLKAEWFDNVVSTLRAHELQLETNTANPEVKKLYEIFIAGNADDLAYFGKANAQKHFIPRILVEYLQIVKDRLPLKLAFDFSDSEVLVWAEVKDNDLEMEKHLMKAEAIIGARFHKFGFAVETTIVESSDSLGIPNHYRVYKA